MIICFTRDCIVIREFNHINYDKKITRDSVFLQNKDLLYDTRKEKAFLIQV